MSKYSKLLKNEGEQKSEAVVEKPTTTPVDIPPATPTGINVPSYQSTNIPTEQDSVIDVIHKAMRQSPSAAASYRLSPMEKKRLEVTIFELKMRSGRSPELADLRSNENEVMRVAVNYILNDYGTNGDESVLVKALTSLRS